jgi:hypothetical protein
MNRKALAAPIASIVLLSLGGWLLHLRVHAVSFDPADPSNPANAVPFAAGFLSVIAAPALLMSKRTFVAGYLWNGMSVVVGTVTMASMSVASPPSPPTFGGVMLGTMLSSILLLLPKLFLGEIVLRQYHPNGMGRLFTAGWWARHFVYIAAVFSIGRIVWR